MEINFVYSIDQQTSSRLLEMHNTEAATLNVTAREALSTEERMIYICIYTALIMMGRWGCGEQ